eukprot:TRINITY_DN29700_c0_g1_i2.p1 TRINITY_DN29700_c0_g1~~TRINITY_DN29700_c0_g1_i2.p1  ORF type:complete len:379 (+),score=57.63 TRINITY_DN29700_c0_g1_i2:24-1160(+)
MVFVIHFMKLAVLRMSLAMLFFALTQSASADDIDRRLGAIVGAAVADAASMPLHWIYDTASIESKLGKGSQRVDSAFFSPPSCPFYTYPEGENSPYGQQYRVALASLAKIGHFDAIDMQNSYWSYYGPDDAPCHKRQGTSSKEGCYWDGSTKGFIDNYQEGKRWPKVGANDTQANALVHMVPLVALLAGRRNESFLLSEVASLIRVTQNTDDAVAFGLAGARILSRVIQGDSLVEAVTTVAKTLQDPGRVHPQSEDAFLSHGLDNMLQQLDRPNFDVVKEVGQSCDYPFNLWSGSHLAAQLSPTASANGTLAYMLAVRQTIEAGGDSASRVNFVGALLGAAAGAVRLPSSWTDKYLHYDVVLADAKKLLISSPQWLFA